MAIADFLCRGAASIAFYFTCRAATGVHMQKHGYSRSHREGRKATDRTALCMLHYGDECRYHLIFPALVAMYIWMTTKIKLFISSHTLHYGHASFTIHNFSPSARGVVNPVFISDSLGRINHTTPTQADINPRGRSHISHAINFVSSLQFCTRPLGILSIDIQTL